MVRPTGKITDGGSGVLGGDLASFFLNCELTFVTAC